MFAGPKLKCLYVLHTLTLIKPLTSNAKAWKFPLPFLFPSLFFIPPSNWRLWHTCLTFLPFEIQTNKPCCFHNNTVNFCSHILSALSLNYENSLCKESMKINQWYEINEINIWIKSNLFNVWRPLPCWCNDKTYLNMFSGFPFSDNYMSCQCCEWLL